MVSALAAIALLVLMAVFIAAIANARGIALTRRVSATLAIFASVPLLLWSFVALGGLDSRRGAAHVLLSGFSGFALQFLSARLLQPRVAATQASTADTTGGELTELWTHFWFRLFVLFGLTVLLGVLVVGVLIGYV